MRVCVTGGTGFLGTALVRRLLAEGSSVRVLARPSQRADELEAHGAELVRGDLKDAEAVERAVAGVEIVYHAGAKVEGSGSRAEFIETNVGGTQRVFEACIRQGVPHVVHMSSIAVYGPVRDGERIDERTPCDDNREERDYYAQSKILADEYAVAIGIEAKLAVTILRPGILYGPGRSLPVSLLGFRAGKTNVVFGNRRHRIPLVYVENLVDAMLFTSRFKEERLRQYIIVDDENLTLGQYHAVRTEIEKTRTLFLPGWPVLLAAIGVEGLMRLPPLGFGADGIRWRQVRRALQDRFYDTRRIREETGWSPKVPLKEAIERTPGTSH